MGYDPDFSAIERRIQEPPDELYGPRDDVVECPECGCRDVHYVAGIEYECGECGETWDA